MAKAGGRRKAAARLFIPVILASTMLAAVRGGLRAQALEVRAGLAGPAVLAREAPGQEGSAATSRAGAAPLLGLTALLALRPRLELEASGAWEFSRLAGTAASGSWQAGKLGIGQVLVGVRYAPAERPYVRVAVGAVRYVSRRGIFMAGSSPEPALEAGVGWARPAGSWRIGAELTAQLQAFDTQALSEAGAGAGGVRRLFAVLTLRRGRVR